MNDMSMTPRILFIGDESESGALTVAFHDLDAVYVHVEDVPSVEQALAHLGKQSFKCLVADVDLLDFDGLDFLETVRTAHGTLPVVFIANTGSKVAPSEAIDAGVSDYFVKGVILDEWKVLANRLLRLIERDGSMDGLQTRVDQLEIIEELSQLAIDEDDLDVVFDLAVRRISAGLDVPLVKVLQYDPHHEALLLRAGIGWDDGLVGTTFVSVDTDSQPGYTLQNEAPVVTANLRNDDRFSTAELLLDHEVISGVTTVIGDSADPWGVLGVHSDEHREFSEDDITFIQSIANLLATTISRADRTQEANDREVQVNVLNRILRHNLRNELTVIRGNIELIEERFPDAHEEIEKSIGAVDRLLDISEKVRKLISYTAPDLERQEIVLHDLIERIGSRFELFYPEMRFEADCPVDKTVFAFPSIELALTELIENAVKHSGERPRVTITVDGSAEDILITVVDDGPGLPIEEQRFLTGRHETQLAHSSGMGLWMVRSIVTAHGGLLDFDTSSNGTEITISLPSDEFATRYTPAISPLEGLRVRERYRSIFEKSVDSMLVLDPAGTITDANPAAGVLFEVSPRELLGRPLHRYLPSLETTPIDALTEVSQEVSVTMDAGTERVVEMSLTEDLILDRYFMILRDITERRYREQLVETERAKYKHLVDALPHGIYRADPATLQPTDVNPAVADIFGYTVEEWLNAPDLWEESIHPEDISRVLAAFEEAQANKTEDELEYRILTNQGALRWVRDTFTWEQDAEGETTALVGVFTDITDRKENELTLQERVKELQVLHGVADTFDNSEIPLEMQMRSLVELIPEAFKEPTQTAVKLSYGNKQVSTDGFEESAIRLSSSYPTADGKVLVLDVVYLGEHNTDEDPFFDEERVLVETLGRVIRDRLERYESEARLQELVQFQEAILESANVWINVLNEQGEVILWNTAAERISGYQDEEVIGNADIWEWLYPDESYRAEITELVGEILAGADHVAGYETEIITKGGDIRVLRWHSHQLLDSGNDAVGSVAVAEDITEQKRWEQELIDTNERFQAYIEYASDLITVIDADGTIKYNSPSVVEILGYDQDELIGKSVFDYVHPEDTERVLEQFETVLDTPTALTAHLEFRFERADGSWVWLESIGSNRRDTAIDGYVINSRDVTDRKVHEKTLAVQRDDLKLLNEVLRHDIRNDLTVIVGFTELLEDHVDEAGAEALQRLNRATYDSIHLTETARDLAKLILEEERSIKAMPVAAVLEQEVGDLRSAYPSAKVALEIASTVKTVQADDLLGSVIRNLLINAVQHNDKSTPEVEVRASKVDDRIEIRVADNGPGISDPIKEAIFERGTSSDESHGTGLGLYLVQSLVDSYGGVVIVEENEPTGAVFVISLHAAA